MSEDHAQQRFKPKAQTKFGRVNFNVGPQDTFLIGRAVTRMMEWLLSRNIRPTDAMAHNLHMDLGAIHSNGCPLDFGALLAMDVTPFVQELIDMGKNLDRDTGKLMNGYKPRCARASGVHIIR